MLKTIKYRSIDLAFMYVCMYVLVRVPQKTYVREIFLLRSLDPSAGITTCTITTCMLICVCVVLPWIHVFDADVAAVSVGFGSQQLLQRWRRRWSIRLTELPKITVFVVAVTIAALAEVMKFTMVGVRLATSLHSRCWDVIA